MKNNSRAVRRVGRPTAGTPSTTDVVRAVVLEFPQLKNPAVLSLAAERLPPDLAPFGVSGPLVAQVVRTMPSHFLRQAVRQGLALEQLTNFLRACGNWPASRVADVLASQVR